jgi:SAM-dependent methyltransferase
MLTQTISAPSLLPGNSAKPALWRGWNQSRQAIDWAIRQLNVQRFQQLLEVGCGSGLLLAAAARELKAGFIAGIESSFPLYVQACRRNQRFVKQERMQLHLGELPALPYPPHYFNTIYSFNAHLSWPDPGAECIRLATLLQNRGKLLLFIPPGRRGGAKPGDMADRLQKHLSLAGLTEINTSYSGLAFGKVIAVSGVK